MTGYTVIHKARVINDISRRPCTCAMANIALGQSGNVCCGLTGGDHIVMTARARTNYLRVIYGIVGNWRPLSRENLVTGIANIC